METLLSPTYDIPLVALSFVVVAMASYAALHLTGRITRAGTDRPMAWLAGGSLALGFGIWSLHFIGMLAFRIPVPVDYDLALVLGSLLFAVAASGFSLEVATRARPHARRVAVAGCLLAVGIVGMHHIGMSAVETPARREWSWLLLALSVGVALGASVGAIWLAFRRRSESGGVRVRRLGAATLMGVAVTGMHYTGMAAARFHLPEGVVRSANLLDAPVWLVLGIAVAAVVLIGLLLLGNLASLSGERRRLGYLTAIMTAVALAVAGVGMAVLYRVTVETQEVDLRYLVESEARLIESMARFDEEYLAEDFPGDVERAILQQVSGAYAETGGFGETGRFLLARGEPDSFTMLGATRSVVPGDSAWAEPYRRALAGESGVMRAPTITGEAALVAYEPLELLDLALFASVSMSEIRAPFIRVGLFSGAAAIALVLLGSAFFVTFTRPLAESLEEGEVVAELLDSLPQALLVENESRVIVRVNEGFEALFGYPADEVIGRRNDGFLSAEEDQGTLADLDREIRETGTGSAEFRGLRKDGTSVWIRASGRLAPALEEGALILVGEDIGEMREARRAAEKARERYRELVESSGDLVWSVDSEGEWSFLNEASGEVYGRDPDELMGTPFLDLSAPERRSADKRVLESVLRGRPMYDHETVHLDAEGERVHLSFSGRAMEEDGVIVGAQGTAREVGSRVAAREALQDLVRQHSLVQSLMNATSDVIFYKDDEGVYQGCNEAFAKLVGMSEEEIVGKTDYDLYAADVADHFVQGDRDAFEAGEAITSEAWETLPDGSEVYFETVKTPYFGPDGEALGLIGISRDVTERKRTEARLHAMAEEAERANRMKSAFLANMSHEIRTPMNGVLGMTELLLDTELDEGQRHSAELIRSSAESLLAILNDILDLSKIEADRLELETVSFDLPKAMEAAASILGVKAAEKGIEILVDVAPDVPTAVEGDPNRLRQVLTNLMGNAIKFTEVGGVVLRARRVRSEGDVTHVRFSVQDTGVGVPREKLDTIFKEFGQADASTTREYGGTGLGLTISRRLVELMGGSLEVESEVGEGSEFYFTLALAESDGSVGEPARRRFADLEGARLLIVDDNPVNRRVLSDFLEAAGATTEDRPGADAALERLLTAQGDRAGFDAVVTDSLMPGKDGFELARMIRAESKLEGLPLVLVTSAADPGQATRAREEGIDAFLSKPVSRSGLLLTVAAVLGRRGGVEEDRGLLTLDSVESEIPRLRVLLAEDNEVNRLVATSLLRNRGHQVKEVTDGRAALEAVQDGDFDVVLMDVQMPEMDGLEATRRIRDLGEGYEPGELPIVALTAHAMAEERGRCVEAGMNRYLSKPFKPFELYGVVEGWRVQRPDEGGAGEEVEEGAGASGERAEPSAVTEAPLEASEEASEKTAEETAEGTAETAEETVQETAEETAEEVGRTEEEAPGRPVGEGRPAGGAQPPRSSAARPPEVAPTAERAPAAEPAPTAEPPPVAEDGEPLDLDGFRSAMEEAGVGDALDGVLRAFEEEAERRFRALRTALEEERLRSVAQISRAYRSAASHVRAGALADVLRRTEAAGRRGEAEAVERWLDQVGEEQERVLARLREHLS